MGSTLHLHGLVTVGASFGSSAALPTPKLQVHTALPISSPLPPEGGGIIETDRRTPVLSPLQLKGGGTMVTEALYLSSNLNSIVAPFLRNRGQKQLGRQTTSYSKRFPLECMDYQWQLALCRQAQNNSTLMLHRPHKSGSRFLNATGATNRAVLHT